jgi:hypothetical protein
MEASLSESSLRQSRFPSVDCSLMIETMAQGMKESAAIRKTAWTRVSPRPQWPPYLSLPPPAANSDWMQQEVKEEPVEFPLDAVNDVSHLRWKWCYGISSGDISFHKCDGKWFWEWRDDAEAWKVSISSPTGKKDQEQEARIQQPVIFFIFLYKEMLKNINYFSKALMDNDEKNWNFSSIWL